MAVTGEVRLGGGAGFLFMPGGDRYCVALSRNLVVICHEVGHHVCQHTADLRLNRLRPAGEQTNKKIALDGGTSGLLSAIGLNRPDICRWHRVAMPTWDPRRRALGPQWIMGHFRGGRTDGATRAELRQVGRASRLVAVGE